MRAGIVASPQWLEAMSDRVDIGPFRAERLLANGTRTQVWAAVRGGKTVAVKLARNDAVRPAMLREIEVYKALQPPGLPGFIEADPKGRWFAMELVEGVAIDKWARNDREKTLADVAIQILEVLHHLHGQGVIHGDIKPSNILISTDGIPTLVDFGSATFVGKQMKGFHGTLGFAAPEVLAGEVPTPASDMYGFGAMLYACLTDRPPFVLPDPAALAYVPTQCLPAPPSTWVPGIPARVDHLVLALLARSPDKRPSDARLISQALLTTPRAKMAKRVLGMHAERDALRRLVVSASQGQAKAAVIYGPAGSGRLTLITETIEAAIREGMQYLAGVTPMAAKDAIAESKKPPALVFRIGQRGAQSVVQELLELGRPLLILIHSDRPLPRIEGAEQITPAPLNRTDASQLVATLGGDMAKAEEWRDASAGLPIGIVGRCRKWMRERQGDAPERASLPSKSRRVLTALDTMGECSLDELAAAVRMPENAVVDHCEVLIAEGFIEVTGAGSMIRLTTPVSEVTQ